MTAYFGLLEIGDLREGENVFVSGAAGAVGSLVGQIAKIRNCRVAGSAGSARKIDWLRGELGFDEAFNYKEIDDYKAKLDEVMPEGVDVYFDNVGGPLTDAVFTRLRTGARIVLCGQIDQYNATETPQGPRKLWLLILKQARAEGFLVYQFRERWDQGRRQMADWIRQGRIQCRETIAEGIDQAPRAFIGLFKGDNIGKQIVKIAEV
jgi:NADPH-dependent curcumin reductase CurA